MAEAKGFIAVTDAEVWEVIGRQVSLRRSST